MAWRTMGVWCAAALAAAVLAGCGTVTSGGAVASSGTSPVRTTTAGAVTPTPVTRSPGKSSQPIWLRSFQMTSATTGWALYYSGNPSSSAPVFMRLAKTVNGGRTWTDVTPAAALPMLKTAGAAQVLDPVDGARAYLAVTPASLSLSLGVKTTTELFTTTDGGRTWTESAPLRAQSLVSEVSFSDPAHGFVMVGGDGGSMGQDPVWLYRTADGGQHWSLAAATPPLTPVSSPEFGPREIPRFCDKYGLIFPTATTGWISSTCNAGLTGTLLLTRDGGRDWSDQPLPLPASICTGNACTATGPEFADGTGFLTVADLVAAPALLETRNLGQTWQQVPLPVGPGVDPQVTFFNPRQGILIPAGTQGSFGRSFYTTADGGQSWTPVPQGTHFTTKYAVGIDFTSTRVGFAWATGEESDPVPPTRIYQTTNSGRTWTSFTAKLASSTSLPHHVSHASHGRGFDRGSGYLAASSGSSNSSARRQGLTQMDRAILMLTSVRDKADDRLHIPADNGIDTQSNLNSDLLFDLCASLGLDATPLQPRRR